uniref:MRH domain-containing protein n=1 Tax=Chromera velia CCMP2878 TaxID=1169474 RepID=A0A0G4HBJ2_9ALVE|eukprot:Cvel_25991.t1-p1 / transcript=Cvel_25991.t1 / gene=Cvel_25991 / organism=Chromera_velia_CCMP2878 / gene_product=hypothetical protein / transcript_product=hypothetical protein / location=Cvel_scaffold3022:1309-5276(-) / protein_length=461 / sequence_SO=supercontig / SO=protein_coding / is_pseudo=false
MTKEEERQAERLSQEHRVQLRTMKAVYLYKKCVYVNRSTDQYWTYEICYASVVNQVKATEITGTRTEAHHLGNFNPQEELFFPNGSMVQMYTNGSSGRTTTMTYVCAYGAPHVIQVDEPSPLRYEVTVEGPAFCDWRRPTAGGGGRKGRGGKDVGGNTKTTSELLLALADAKSSGRQIPSGSIPVWWLLSGLTFKRPPAPPPAPDAKFSRDNETDQEGGIRGSGFCTEWTSGWWTYEYCHHDEEGAKEARVSIWQFHRDQKGVTVDPPFSLGRLPLPVGAPLAGDRAQAAGEAHKEASSPRRGKKGYILDSVGTIEEVKHWGKALVMRFAGGTPCDDGIGRQAKLFFVCPATVRDVWLESIGRPPGATPEGVADPPPQADAKMVKVTRSCFYEVFIETPYVCAHPELMPPLESKVVTIDCGLDTSRDGEVVRDRPRAFAAADAAVAAGHSARSGSRPREDL